MTSKGLDVRSGGRSGGGQQEREVWKSIRESGVESSGVESSAWARYPIYGHACEWVSVCVYLCANVGAFVRACVCMCGTVRSVPGHSEASSASRRRTTSAAEGLLRLLWCVQSHTSCCSASGQSGMAGSRLSSPRSAARTCVDGQAQAAASGHSASVAPAAAPPSCASILSVPHLPLIEWPWQAFGLRMDLPLTPSCALQRIAA